MKKHLISLAAAAATSVLAGAAVAQDEYPNQSITMVVPFSAGGPTDTVTRLITEPMGQVLGQGFVVQNGWW